MYVCRKTVVVCCVMVYFVYFAHILLETDRNHIFITTETKTDAIYPGVKLKSQLINAYAQVFHRGASYIPGLWFSYL